MIPKNISFESVIKALGLIDKKGIPEDRHSVKYSLEHEGILYPPKYVISIANMFENNEEWLPENFSGGRETNQFLEELGFKIINVGSEPFDYPFESHSWKAISDSVAIKILDKSAFLHHGSGIPRDFKFYFGLDNFNIDEPKNIIFIHRNNHFDATFQMDKPLKRLRLFWKSDFAEVLKKTFPEWYRSFSQDVEWESERPEMRFQKLRESEYQIDFIHPEKINLDI